MTDSQHTLPADAMPPAPMKILCVDDNADVADSLGELLTMVGHEVVVCHGGSAALEAVAAGFRPDVCLLDISMPGFDGYQIAAALRATRDEGDLLIVAVTAVGDYHSMERMVDSGFDLYFSKPVFPEDLYAAINDRAARLVAVPSN